MLFLKSGKNKKLLVRKVVHRKNSFSKGSGLMFHKKILDEAHVFHFKKARKLSLTMFFVFFPIDVVFLDKGVVTELKKGFRPFSNYTSLNKADTFIELPSGFIDKKKIGIGDKIVFD